MQQIVYLEKNTKKVPSFFEQFTPERIFGVWSSSDTLLEIAQKLGFKNEAGSGLSRVDYEYILSVKDRDNWHKNVVSVNRKKERKRYAYVSNLSSENLSLSINCEGIETLSHLALHYLISPKHGRKVVRKRILELQLNVKTSLYKGVYGVSETPQHWPTKNYEKRKGQKPIVCPVCNFEATIPQQIELHHPDDIDKGPKSKRNPIYYQTQDLQPMCANCHSLEHRTGEHLLKSCGAWQIKKPVNLIHKDPNLIFSDNCLQNYRIQKNYYLKWYFTNSDQYNCNDCGVTYWGKDKKLLSLELHHKDRNHKNSQISNLTLLCPNCHRAK